MKLNVSIPDETFLSFSCIVLAISTVAKVNFMLHYKSVVMHYSVFCSLSSSLAQIYYCMHLSSSCSVLFCTVLFGAFTEPLAAVVS